MDGFRRLIIGLADILALCAIVVFTVLGAFLGYSLGNAAGSFDRNSTAPVGSVMLGAVAGFGISAMAAALMFTLSEIASNTRTLLQRGWTPSSAREQIATPGATGDIATLSQEAHAVIRKAQVQGYRVRLTTDKAGFFVSSTLGDFRLYSESDILDFGRRLK